jgi:hypothetical protein
MDHLSPRIDRSHVSGRQVVNTERHLSSRRHAAVLRCVQREVDELALGPRRRRVTSADPAIAPSVIVNMQVETEPVAVEPDGPVEVRHLHHHSDETTRGGHLHTLPAEPAPRVADRQVCPSEMSMAVRSRPRSAGSVSRLPLIRDWSSELPRLDDDALAERIALAQSRESSGKGSKGRRLWKELRQQAEAELERRTSS